MNNTAFLIHESAAEYHAQAKRHLSSHALADFRKCPQLFIHKRRGIITDEDRPAYLIGRALHTLALEGEERFCAEFAVGGPINEKTGQRFGAATKAFAEWAAQQGKPPHGPRNGVLAAPPAQGACGCGLAGAPGWTAVRALGAQVFRL